MSHWGALEYGNTCQQQKLQPGLSVFLWTAMESDQNQAFSEVSIAERHI